jgi:transcriptional regulator GlxA family with amidase domain
MSKKKLKQEDLEKVNCVKSLIEKNYCVHYTHEELAHLAGTNDYKLKTLFKTATKMTLYEYLCCVRVERAQELLQFTDYSIPVIARKIGLDKSNFSKLFKKVTNETPAVWRRKVRQGKDAKALTNKPKKSSIKNSRNRKN